LEKRFFLAIALSFFVISLYSTFLKKSNLLKTRSYKQNSRIVNTAVIDEPAVEMPVSSQAQEASNILEDNKLYVISSNNFDWKFSKMAGIWQRYLIQKIISSSF